MASLRALAGVVRFCSSGGPCCGFRCPSPVVAPSGGVSRHNTAGAPQTVFREFCFEILARKCRRAAIEARTAAAASVPEHISSFATFRM